MNNIARSQNYITMGKCNSKWNWFMIEALASNMMAWIKTSPYINTPHNWVYNKIENGQAWNGGNLLLLMMRGAWHKKMLRNNTLSHNSGGKENFVASCVFCKNHFEKGLIQG